MITRRSILSALPALALHSWLCRAQDGDALTDPALTRDLISTPGPTFQVDDKSLEHHWTLISYGDMRFTDPNNQKVTNPKVRRWLVNRIAAEHPDAVLLSGDVPYDGSVANDYEVYRQETQVWRDARLRVYPAMGNHELHGDEVRFPRNWWHAFPELKNRRWYSVAMADTWIISLDSNLSLTEGSRQRQWLVDQFAHLPAKIEFLFISLHHPPVADSIENNHSHDVRPNEHSLALLLEAQAKVSSAKFIVAAGHIHNYQRFLEGGVVYLVSGGGGAKPVPVARTSADRYQDSSFPNYHYVKFTRNKRGLSAEMFRIQDPESAQPVWEVKDRFDVS